jgi:hypothetical protein
MMVFYHVWAVLIGHGHAAVIEFIVDMGDHVITHLIAVVVLKAGVLHVGCKVVKRVRSRKVAMATKEDGEDKDEKEVSKVHSPD